MKTKFIVSFLLSVFCLLAEPSKIQKNIMVDQFGYRPDDFKTAVIADPQLGFKADSNFVPANVLQVRDWNTDKVVFSGEIKVWSEGKMDITSGDKGWWFDFSSLKTEGDYYIYDSLNNAGSGKFSIKKDIYKDILKAACRVFYYQRINDPKETPYAEEPWTDSAAFISQWQDTQARYLNDRDNPATARDLSGGWMDAGDCNKYVTFTSSPVHMLLTAYQQNPGVFTDDYNIPESGNGIPDIVDEVKYEIDWVKKMQLDDGGLLIKIGNIDWNTAWPPSADKRPRYYGPECSSSSIAGAGMFAHAAIVLGRFAKYKDYADDLKIRAEKAWNWYKENPKCDTCDSQEIKSGDADVSLRMQDQMEFISAVYLFALTGDQKYNEVILKNYINAIPLFDFGTYLYFSHSGDALLYYTTIKNADEKVKNFILEFRKNLQRGADIFQTRGDLDLYMSYLPTSLYSWGSNNPRSSLGSANYDAITYGLTDLPERVKNRSLGVLHYFHGVNPLGIVYLSNMHKYGSEYSCDKIWHDWFRVGTKFESNPAPGYVTGGPNYYYNGGLEEIKRQPPQKCYKNTNIAFPDQSWELTEPAIYYQASYIKLLSKFVGN